MTLVHEITHLLAKAMLGTDQNTPEISKDRSWITCEMLDSPDPGHIVEVLWLGSLCMVQSHLRVFVPLNLREPAFADNSRLSRPADDLCVTNPTGNEVDVAAPCWRGIYSDQ
ncbi:hypothetical protein Moror_8299 [Moniliophthora roreri MCA 2997]|uniref:Uncharacterized protein n=1 Tax=Moniliophthora roreri (strain MCA 2997) TaxID=1381753 RepID=V2X507_MONRO|nr:hypothetical protein Moror_8299 [Moniliophthora roreri MCA 2997]